MLFISGYLQGKTLTYGSIWSKCIFLFVLISQYQILYADRGGYLYFKFLCYHNLGHLDVQGYKCDSVPSINCDPEFTICISNIQITGPISAEKCPIHYQKTNSFDNEETVCNQGFDNRRELRSTIEKELPYPIPDQVYVKIDIQDLDQFSNNAHIASFNAELSQKPSQNSRAPLFKDINMYRTDFRYGNSRASLKIAMALQCVKDRFGKHCQILCQAFPFSYFTCSDTGKKICKEGWKGEECMMRDVCIYQACAENAQCIEINGEAKCKCNGEFGPQCYPNYNPCSINPCENGGFCIPNKTNGIGIRCSCNYPFVGVRCEEKFDICTYEPCQNNATCYYSANHIRHCNCTSGFYGMLCDQKMKDLDYDSKYQKSNITALFAKESKSKSTVVLGALFGSLVLVAVIIAIVLLIKRRDDIQKKFKNCKSETISMGDIEKRSNNNSKYENNYFECPPKEPIYETVDDMKTYSYLKEQNDDYLIPSRPPTPVLPQITDFDNPDYLVLSLSSENCNMEPEMANNHREIYELPELPSRDLKKKLSMKKFCMS